METPFIDYRLFSAMNRRRFLATVVGSGTLLGGCLRLPGMGSGGPTKPDEVAKFEFQLGRSDEPEPLDEGHTHAADAIVESASDPSRLRVVGQLTSGSRSCKETRLHALEYDHGTLTVEVLDDHVAGPNEACTSESAVVGYELLVTFEDVLPTTLDVTHFANTSFSETIDIQ